MEATLHDDLTTTLRLGPAELAFLQGVFAAVYPDEGFHSPAATEFTDDLLALPGLPQLRGETERYVGERIGRLGPIDRDDLTRIIVGAAGRMGVLAELAAALEFGLTVYEAPAPPRVPGLSDEVQALVGGFVGQLRDTSEQRAEPPSEARFETSRGGRL